MKRISSLLAAAFLIAWLTTGTAGADCRGCCSGHGGVVCAGGVTRCADGTGLSSKCRAKGCDKCGGSSSSSSYKRSTTPSSTYSPPSTSGSSVGSPTPTTPATDSPSGEKQDKNTVIVLKNGKRIKTEGAWEEDGQVKCMRFGAVVGYPKADVERIERE